MKESTPTRQIKCPECGGTDLCGAGLTIRARQKVRRYICKKCLLKFTEPK